ncbi:hypothetical protein ES705_42078 [subsurface metagenome]
MITEEDLQKTNISLSYSISPVQNIICDLSALIGDFCEELIGSFYTRVVSKKANVVITELLNNAIENILDKDSGIILNVKINEDRLLIEVMNVVNRKQYEKVKAQVQKINSANNIRELLKETIQQRRGKRLKGGLGLIRVVAENKFNISVDYKEPFLIVESQISLGGLN